MLSKRRPKPDDTGIDLSSSQGGKVVPSSPSGTTKPAAPMKAQIINVDSELKAIARRVKGNARKATEAYLAMGEDLAQAQLLLANGGNGSFGKWLETTGISKSAAYRAMSAHKTLGGLPHVGKLVAIEAVSKIASAPDVVVKAVRESVEAGDRIDTKAVAKLVAKYSPPEDKPAKELPQIIHTPSGSVAVTTKGTATAQSVLLAALGQLRDTKAA